MVCPIKERESALRSFKSGDTPISVATDVDPYSSSTYGLTHVYESIVATGWD